MSRKKDGRIGISHEMDAEVHWCLKVWCAEEKLTLKQGIERIVRERLVGMKQRLGAPPWARGAVPVAGFDVQPVMPAALAQSRAGPIGEAFKHKVVAHEVHKVDDDPPPPELLEALNRSLTPDIVDAIESGESRVLMQLKEGRADPGSRHRDHALVLPHREEPEGYDADEAYERYRKQGHSREVAIERVQVELEDTGLAWQPPDEPVEIATSGPITSHEFEVPGDWVARDGVSRAENLRRYGEDEEIEYWPPVKAAHMDVDAPLDITALKS